MMYFVLFVQGIVHRICHEYENPVKELDRLDGAGRIFIIDNPLT